MPHPNSDFVRTSNNPNVKRSIKEFFSAGRVNPDKFILNMDNIRKAARIIILDEKKEKIAVLEVKNGDYHKIPGGGIENDESVETAAIREALEEGGCNVQLIKKIGESEFIDPDDQSLIHHSICFLAKKTNDHKISYFTKEEMEKKFRLLWLSFDEAIKLFKDVKSKIPFELEMNNRDLKFIKMAKGYLSNKNI